MITNAGASIVIKGMAIQFRHIDCWEEHPSILLARAMTHYVKTIRGSTHNSAAAATIVGYKPCQLASLH